MTFSLGYFIKKYIKKVIESEKIREVNRNNNIYSISFLDSTSIIKMPSTIDGGKYISIGSHSRIGMYSWIAAFDSYQSQNFNPTILIGNNVNIGNFSCITAIDQIKINDGCLMSEGVYISDHAHGFDPTTGISPGYQNLNSKGRVEIGRNSFVGIRACIMPGVVIGENCVIGAHSIVTHSFPSYCMIAGAPAKVIKTFNIHNSSWENV